MAKEVLLGPRLNRTGHRTVLGTRVRSALNIEHHDEDKILLVRLRGPRRKFPLSRQWDTKL